MLGTTTDQKVGGSNPSGRALCCRGKSRRDLRQTRSSRNRGDLKGGVRCCTAASPGTIVRGRGPRLEVRRRRGAHVDGMTDEAGTLPLPHRFRSGQQLPGRGRRRAYRHRRRPSRPLDGARDGTRAHGPLARRHPRCHPYHGDTDHIGFAERLRRERGIAVHVHELDAARAVARSRRRTSAGDRSRSARCWAFCGTARGTADCVFHQSPRSSRSPTAQYSICRAPRASSTFRVIRPAAWPSTCQQLMHCSWVTR